MKEGAEFVGTLKFFKTEGGFGYVICDDLPFDQRVPEKYKTQVMIRKANFCKEHDHAELKPGVQVTFTLRCGPKGWWGDNVKVGDSPLFRVGGLPKQILFYLRVKEAEIPVFEKYENIEEMAWPALLFKDTGLKICGLVRGTRHATIMFASEKQFPTAVAAARNSKYWRDLASWYQTIRPLLDEPPTCLAGKVDLDAHLS